MSAFTRLTVVGSVKRVDLVVPSDEPVANVLPEVLRLIGESESYDGSPIALVRRTGEQVEPASTPDDADLLDGDVLRVLRADAAPPPPEVADVTDVVADALVERRDRWNGTARRATGFVAVVAATWLLALATRGLFAPAVEQIVLLTAIGALVVVAVVCGRLGQDWPREAATAIALGLAPPAASAVAGLAPAHPMETAIAGTVALAGTVVGLGLGTAARRAAVAWGAGAGALAAIIALVLLATPLPLIADAAFLGIAAVLAIGLLPTFALTASGLSGLDDDAIAGSLPARERVASSLDDAYAALTWTAVALAAVAGTAGVVLIRSDDVYAAILGAAIALVLALRTRQFPLVQHVVPLWIAAVAVAVAGAGSPLLPERGGAVVLGGILVLALLLTGVRPSPHARVRWRRAGSVLELVAVLATIPMLLGVLDVYPSLLTTFTR